MIALILVLQQSIENHSTQVRNYFAYSFTTQHFTNDWRVLPSPPLLSSSSVEQAENKLDACVTEKINLNTGRKRDLQFLVRHVWAV